MKNTMLNMAADDTNIFLCYEKSGNNRAQIIRSGRDRGRSSVCLGSVFKIISAHTFTRHRTSNCGIVHFYHIINGVRSNYLFLKHFFRSYFLQNRYKVICSSIHRNYYMYSHKQYSTHIKKSLR